MSTMRRYVVELFSGRAEMLHYAVSTSEGACECGCGRGLITYCRGSGVGPEASEGLAFTGDIPICGKCQEAARLRHSVDGSWGDRNLVILQDLLSEVRRSRS